MPRFAPSVRLVVDLKAGYPAFRSNEIVNACYVRFGRRPARKTVRRVLAEEPAPRTSPRTSRCCTLPSSVTDPPRPW